MGDIGSHWLDLTQFVTGRRIASLLADLHTAIPVRQRPTGPVETFAKADDVASVPAEMRTEDLAHILLRFESGARGSVVISQVSAGRRNHVAFEVDGSAGAIHWNSERNEELWLGHRARPNEAGRFAAPARGARYPATPSASRTIRACSARCAAA